MCVIDTIDDFDEDQEDDHDDETDDDDDEPGDVDVSAVSQEPSSDKAPGSRKRKAGGKEPSGKRQKKVLALLCMFSFFGSTISRRAAPPRQRSARATAVAPPAPSRSPTATARLATGPARGKAAARHSPALRLSSIISLISTSAARAYFFLLLLSC